MAGQPYNPQIPPTDSAGYVPPAPPETSWPKTLGIIMIIFGAFGTIGSIVGLFAWRLMEFALKQTGNAEIMQSPLIQRWMLLTTVFAGMFLVLAILLLVSGIGLVKRRAWAVRTSSVWAGLKIILEVASVLAHWIMQQKIAQAVEAGAIDAEAAKNLVAKGGASVVAMLPGLALAIALPVFVLIWLSLATTKEETSRWT